ncbi:glycosyltransferase family 2 protein [Azospirillum halopraeferens]|uniref:glycosyltransferase family 2 protein n=1 Tax=Azospirillum halopraeferens TaxID=34010 RepID=UPI0003FD16C5|nr:glycosyltransferase family 2 protein [Azospirillum halopraeferens]
MPGFSLITPSFNHAAYLKDTIESVLSQGCAELQYLVMDGGSTDGSDAIIKRYEGRLHYWRSHPDDGQYAAIEEGFSRSDGEIMGWINSDDILCPWTVQTVQRIFHDCPEVEWLTTRFPLVLTERGSGLHCRPKGGFSAAAFRRGDYLPGANRASNGFIQQESTFWRRSLWERAGGRFDRTLSLAADFELWARFFEHAVLWGIDMPLAAFRRHDDQKSRRQRDRYLEEARRVLARYVDIDRLPSNDGHVAWFRLRSAGLGAPELKRFAEPIHSVVFDDARARYTCVVEPA